MADLSHFIETLPPCNRGQICSRGGCDVTVYDSSGTRVAQSTCRGTFHGGTEIKLVAHDHISTNYLPRQGRLVVSNRVPQPPAELIPPLILALEATAI